MTRSVSMKKIALLLMAGLASFTTGCPSTPGHRASRVVDDTVELHTNGGLTSITIGVVSNDDPGTSSIATPILAEDGTIVAHDIQVYDLGWDHIELKQQPSRGSAVVNNMNIVYTSNGTSGTDSFEYTAFTQLGEAGSAEVTVYMLELGDNLAVADGPISLPPGPGMYIDVLKNDVGDNLEIISTTAARFGSVSIVSNPGGIPGAPKILYSRGGGQYASGTDDFTYTITGGSQATVSVVFNGFAEGVFVNSSDSVSVLFKVDASNVVELGSGAVPLVLRPAQGDLGRYQKRDAAATVTVVAETIPPLPGTPVQWTGQIGFDDRIVFSDSPTPTLTKQGRDGF